MPRRGLIRSSIILLPEVIRHQGGHVSRANTERASKPICSLASVESRTEDSSVFERYLTLWLICVFMEAMDSIYDIMNYGLKPSIYCMYKISSQSLVSMPPFSQVYTLTLPSLVGFPDRSFTLTVLQIGSMTVVRGSINS